MRLTLGSQRPRKDQFPAASTPKASGRRLCPAVRRARSVTHVTRIAGRPAVLMVWADEEERGTSSHLRPVVSTEHGGGLPRTLTTGNADPSGAKAATWSRPSCATKASWSPEGDHATSLIHERETCRARGSPLEQEALAVHPCSPRSPRSVRRRAAGRRRTASSPGGCRRRRGRRRAPARGSPSTPSPRSGCLGARRAQRRRTWPSSPRPWKSTCC